MAKLETRTVLLVLSMALAFILVNFSEKLGLLFGMMLAFFAIVTMFDKKVHFMYQTKSLASSYIIGFLGYLSFLAVSTFIVAGAKAFGLASAFELFANTPIPFFADSPLFVFIGWAVLIPNVENLAFFGLWFEGLLDRFVKTDYSLGNIKVIIGAVVIAAGSALFHITAKYGLGSHLSEQLLLVFAFFLIMALITIARGQLLDGIIMHVIANSAGVGVQLKILSTTMFFVVISGLAVVAFLFLRKQNKSIIGALS